MTSNDLKNKVRHNHAQYTYAPRVHWLFLWSFEFTGVIVSICCIVRHPNGITASSNRMQLSVGCVHRNAELFSIGSHELGGFA
eukprot:scaffold354898_cov19-Prasinocladus_malaysianus.AAC.1